MNNYDKLINDILNEGWGKEAGHVALDVAGLVPVVGEVADAAHFIWYLIEGQPLNAIISLVSVIPAIGDLAKTFKYVKAIKNSAQGTELLSKGILKLLWYSKTPNGREKIGKILSVGFNKLNPQQKLKFLKALGADLTPELKAIVMRPGTTGIFGRAEAEAMEKMIFKNFEGWLNKILMTLKGGAVATGSRSLVGNVAVTRPILTRAGARRVDPSNETEKRVAELDPYSVSDTISSLKNDDEIPGLWSGGTGN